MVKQDLDYKEIEQKWQKRWSESKLFEAEPDERKKFFANFPYPYINAYPHMGHLYTLMRVEALQRYKRLRGYNVLFAQGWHATGSPIVLAAKRVKSREPKQVKIMKDMGFTEEDLVKFEDPRYWIEFFAPQFKSDFKKLGVSVDWRREFHTTSLNPRYDKFIKWQFRKLKEKGYVIKGKFPVVWDPIEKIAVGDHDRSSGEGEVPQQFCLFKFGLDDGRKIVTATLRPDTVMGITNVYVHPGVVYKEIETKGERWIVAAPIIDKLKEQDFDIKVKDDVKGSDLIGRVVKSFSGSQIPVLPATFIDEKYGTGIVHSVPSDSADDYIALMNLKDDEETIKKYGLDPSVVKDIEPIAVFDTPGIGAFPAQHFIDKEKVGSQDDRKKLEKIKKELYKLTFNQATFNDKYAKGFSKDLSGTLVKDGQDIIKRDLKKKGAIEYFYELTGPVVSRGLNECIVKIVSDQWFMDYANPEWKKLAHECLDSMRLYPDNIRAQFDYVIDWLHEWACTREEGLGTRLPWDEKWLIESLSDSTIYMAFYTINHILKDIPEDQIDDELFDYVIYSKDEADIKCDKAQADRMRKEFEYWYPVDYRNSGKDLIQNHLTFFIFNHVAMFPKDKWPKAIGANGWVTADGQKMSKSLGNFILIRDAIDQYGADPARVTILSGGEGIDDSNWDSKLAESMNSKLQRYAAFCNKYHGKGVSIKRPIDDWMISQLYRTISDVTGLMDESLFRSAIKKAYFDLNNIIKWYLKRCDGKPSKGVMDEVIESQVVMLSPFMPHVCEEIWESLGKDGFVSSASWPGFDRSKIQQVDTETPVKQLMDDINAVMDIIGMKDASSIKVYLAAPWKYGLYSLLKERMAETRDQKEIISSVMKTDLKKHGKDVMKMVPKILKKGVIPEHLAMEDERKIFESASSYISEAMSANVEIIHEEDSKAPKAKVAMPGKPGIEVF